MINSQTQQMSRRTMSHIDPSRALALLWIPVGLAMLFMFTICSSSPLRSLGVVAAWIALQHGLNWWAGVWLDDRWPASDPHSAIGRSVLACIVGAMITWPLLGWFLPEQLNSCSP